MSAYFILEGAVAIFCVDRVGAYALPVAVITSKRVYVNEQLLVTLS